MTFVSKSMYSFANKHVYAPSMPELGFNCFGSGLVTHMSNANTTACSYKSKNIVYLPPPSHNEFEKGIALVVQFFFPYPPPLPIQPFHLLSPVACHHH